MWAMYAIVIGAGEVGFSVAQRLSEEEHDVVVVDSADERLERCRDLLDVATVTGSGSHERILRQAEIERADLLIAVTDIDEVNIVACMIAKKLDVKRRIARVTQVEEEGGLCRVTAEDLGVTQLINPNKETVRDIRNLLRHYAANEVVEYAGGKLTLVRVPVGKGAPLAGKELWEIDHGESDRAFSIVSIQRGDSTIIPHGEDRVEADDQISCICRSEAITDVIYLAGQRTESIQRVMIVGGGDLGRNLAHRLEDDRIDVTLLERDRSVCLRLNEELTHTLVLQGDGTDTQLLKSEGVGEMDAFIALTPSEENNILSALMARHCGCRKVVTLIRRPDYVSLMPSIGLHAAVSKRLSTVGGILRSVRRSSIVSVTLFKDSDAESIEVRAAKGACMVGRALSRPNKFPRNALIGAVVRGADGKETVELAAGNTIIEPGDRVVVFGLKEAVRRAEALLG
jgi:trk system potassium uptake protein TrkA